MGHISDRFGAQEHPKGLPNQPLPSFCPLIRAILERVTSSERSPITENACMNIKIYVNTRPTKTVTSYSLGVKNFQFMITSYSAGVASPAAPRAMPITARPKAKLFPMELNLWFIEFPP